MNTTSKFPQSIAMQKNLASVNETVAIADASANESRSAFMTASPQRLQFILPQMPYKPIEFLPYKLPPPPAADASIFYTPQELIQAIVDSVKHPELRNVLQTAVQHQSVEFVMCMCRDQGRFMEQYVVECLKDAAVDIADHYSVAEVIREAAYVAIILMGCVTLLKSSDFSSGTASDFLFALVRDDLLALQETAPLQAGMLRHCLDWHEEDSEHDTKINIMFGLKRRMQCSLDLAFNYRKYS